MHDPFVAERHEVVDGEGAAGDVVGAHRHQVRDARVLAADDHGGAVGGEGPRSAVREPVPEGDDALHPELQELLELRPLGRGVLPAHDDDGAAVAAPRLGLHRLQQVGGDRVVKVERKDADGTGPWAPRAWAAALRR